MKTQNTGNKAQIKTKSTNHPEPDASRRYRAGAGRNVCVFSRLCSVSLGFVFLFFGKSTLASNHLTDQPGINLTIQDVMGIITGLACWITRVALVFIVVAVVYFGVKFLTAQGDPTKLGDAKKSFFWGLVGIIVILGTYTIIATVAYNLGVTEYGRFIPLRCPAF
ncbi:MAG: hypothetical protein HY505_01635 [Candidatus Yanofskybacteria bacterium]|nr:hypothetical protein [Candidatus Yanofskybacteria bacterium]